MKYWFNAKIWPGQKKFGVNTKFSFHRIAPSFQLKTSNMTKNIFKPLAWILASAVLIPIQAQADGWDIDYAKAILSHEVTAENIYNEFVRGHYAYALELVARRVANDPELQKKLVAMGADYLNEIINNKNLSDDQKLDLVMRKMEQSFGPYVSPRVGPAGLSFKHSIAFGVNRLEWDAKELKQTCDKKGSVGYGCTNGQCSGTGSYSEIKGTIYPDYEVFRIENGQEVSIKKIKGGMTIDDKSYNISSAASALTSGLKYAYSKYVKGDNKDYSRLVFDDYISLNRNAGSTLAYRVTTNYQPYKYLKCGSNEITQSMATFDGNGDLRPDFIAASVYETPPSLALKNPNVVGSVGAIVDLAITGGIPPFTITANKKSCTSGTARAPCPLDVEIGESTVGLMSRIACGGTILADYDIKVKDGAGRETLPSTAHAQIFRTPLVGNEALCGRIN